jgi:hypothetical protein
VRTYTIHSGPKTEGRKARDERRVTDMHRARIADASQLVDVVEVVFDRDQLDPGTRMV